MKMPESISYLTADTIAETFNGIGSDLYAKLWSFVTNAENPTPLGGDGSNNTVETPDGRLSLDNDDKPNHWWKRLTDDEHQSIIQGDPNV